MLWLGNKLTHDTIHGKEGHTGMGKGKEQIATRHPRHRGSTLGGQSPYHLTLKIRVA